MLRTFIFQEKEKSWLEESKNLLSNDLVAILDEQEKKSTCGMVLILLEKGLKRDMNRQ